MDIAEQHNDLNKWLTKAQDYLVIPIHIGVTNHCIIEGEIEGNAVKFVLDTGASQSCLAKRTALELELNVLTTEDKAVGLGTNKMKKSVVEVASLLLGDAYELSPYSFAVINLSHINQAMELMQGYRIDGVIGADVLIDYAGVIDYLGACLYLKRKKEK